MRREPTEVLAAEWHVVHALGELVSSAAAALASATASLHYSLAWWHALRLQR